MAKRAEQFVLPALFFVSFFWASKRKKGNNSLFQTEKVTSTVRKNASSPLHLQYKHYPNAIAKKIFIIPLSLYPLLAYQCPTTKNKKRHSHYPRLICRSRCGYFQTSQNHRI